MLDCWGFDWTIGCIDRRYGLGCSFYGDGACVGGVARFLFSVYCSLVVVATRVPLLHALWNSNNYLCGAVMSKRFLWYFCLRSERMHSVALAFLRWVAVVPNMKFNRPGKLIILHVCTAETPPEHTAQRKDKKNKLMVCLITGNMVGLFGRIHFYMCLVPPWAVKKLLWDFWLKQLWNMSLCILFKQLWNISLFPPIWKSTKSKIIQHKRSGFLKKHFDSTCFVDVLLFLQHFP
jgi:hypothetical protein